MKLKSGETIRQKIHYFMPLVSVLFLLILTFIFSFQCRPNFWSNEEAETDSSVFRTIAMMMNRGYMPYRDTFDHKGPLIYLLNWIGLKISYYRGILIIECIFLFFTFIFIYKIIRMFCRRWMSYGMMLVIAAALYPQFDGGNKTEEYAMLFIAVSLFFYTKYFLYNNILFGQVILCGACFGAVCLLRPNMVAVWAVFSIAVLIKCICEKRYKEIGKFLLLFLAGTAIVLIPMVLWLCGEGAFADCINDYILFNLRYFETGVQQKGAQVNAIISFLSAPLILCMMVTVTYLLKGNRDYLTFGYAVCFVVSLFAMTISGRSFVHYAMVLIPLYAYPLGILGNWFEKVLYGKSVDFLLCIYIYLLGILALPNWIMGINHMKDSYGYRDKDNRSEATANVVSYIEKHTDEDEKITVWGNWDIIYVLSQRLPATQYSYQSPIGTVDPEIYDEYFAGLAEEDPSLIIVKKDGTEKLMMDFIEEYEYQKVFENVSNVTVEIYRNPQCGEE